MAHADALTTDNNLGSWTTLTPMPTPRSALAAATAPDGRIYAIGGRTGPTSSPATISLDTVEAFDPVTNAWTRRAPVPTPRADLAAVTGPDGRIYAIGGVTVGAGVNALSVVEAYDPMTDTWAAVAPLPTPRSALAAAVGRDGRIYALGGCCGPDGIAGTVEAYSPATNTWTAEAPIPTPREWFGAATGPDGRIYVAGGLGRAYRESLASVETYDPSANTWAAAPPLPLGRSVLTRYPGRLWLSLVAGGDGRLYAIGGGIAASPDAPDFYLDEVDSYVPGSPEWIHAAPMLSPRKWLAAAAGRDGRVYAIGGEYLSATQVPVTILGTFETYTPPAAPSVQAPCTFVLGFRALHERIPTVVGNCLEDERHSPANGDGLQQTTNGLLVWRKADNVVAFTDGWRTWLLGPRGPGGAAEHRAVCLGTQPWRVNRNGVRTSPMSALLRRGQPHCLRTQGILLEDLAQEAQSSPFANQYDPTQPRWVHDPNLLPDTDMTDAFIPQ